MSGLGKALAIGRVNLLRQLRDRGSLFFIFVLPVVLIVVLIAWAARSTARKMR